MRPITALLAAGAVALPWHVWVALRNFRWIEGFYWVNNVERATTALEGHGGSALLYYPVAVAVGFLPWSVFLAPLIIDWVKRVRRDDPWRAGYILLACWLGVYVVLFSLARTKLPNYVVPAFPALALATGCYLYHLRRSAAATAAWWPQVAVGVLGASGLAAAVGLAVAAHVFLPGNEWLGLVGMIPLAGAAICFAFFRRGHTRAATTAFAACALILVVALVAGVAQQVARGQQIHVLLAKATERSSNPEIAAFERLEPSWVFYSHRNFRLFVEKNRKQLPRFLADQPNRFLLTTAATYQYLQHDLPGEVGELARVPFFLRSGDLVLVGRRDVETELATVPAEGVSKH
jgi:4-amino-4-deoxy-L-arabinose transferase-like glycosyltransferase